MIGTNAITNHPYAGPITASPPIKCCVIFKQPPVSPFSTMTVTPVEVCANAKPTELGSSTLALQMIARKLYCLARLASLAITCVMDIRGLPATITTNAAALMTYFYDFNREICLSKFEFMKRYGADQIGAHGRYCKTSEDCKEELECTNQMCECPEHCTQESRYVYSNSWQYGQSDIIVTCTCPPSSGIITKTVLAIIFVILPILALILGIILCRMRLAKKNPRT